MTFYLVKLFSFRNIVCVAYRFISICDVTHRTSEAGNCETGPSTLSSLVGDFPRMPQSPAFTRPSLKGLGPRTASQVSQFPCFSGCPRRSRVAKQHLPSLQPFAPDSYNSKKSREIFLVFTAKTFWKKNVDFEDSLLPLGINETFCTIDFDEEIRDYIVDSNDCRVNWLTRRKIKEKPTPLEFIKTHSLKKSSCRRNTR